MHLILKHFKPLIEWYYQNSLKWKWPQKWTVFSLSPCPTRQTCYCVRSEPFRRLQLAPFFRPPSLALSISLSIPCSVMHSLSQDAPSHRPLTSPKEVPLRHPPAGHLPRQDLCNPMHARMTVTSKLLVSLYPWAEFRMEILLIATWLRIDSSYSSFDKLALHWLE